ncbi:MAG: hypothetical protein WAW96_19590 [Alphaproteobacteria bacterium]
MTSLWDIKGDNLDPGYINIQNAGSVTERQLRDALSALWACYEPYADPDFREGFAHDPEGRFWEMYVGYKLLRDGKKLMPTAERVRGGGQPDICVLEGDRRIWIEAIAPACGDGEDDGVRGPIPINEGGGFAAAPVRQAQLRTTGALRKKEQKLTDYIDQGVIARDDIRLVAIGAGRFGVSVPEEPQPLILSAVFPIGDEYVTINSETGDVTDHGFVFSPEIQRRGAAVQRTAFLDKTFSHVSGIIWSRVGIGNMSEEARPLSFVHNPLATYPMIRHWGVWNREFVTTQHGDGWQVSDILAEAT